MSGTSLLSRPVSEATADSRCKSAFSSCQMDGLSEEERVHQLLNMSPSQMTADLRMPLNLVVDSELPIASHTYEAAVSGAWELPALKYCESMMIGDCQSDGGILGLALKKDGVGVRFCDFVSEGLGHDAGKQLLETYEVSADLRDDVAMSKVLEVLNDIDFYVPTITYSEYLSSKGMPTYVYRFNEPNPWEGPWKGQASHILDISFLFQLFNDFLEKSQQQLAETFARDVLNFISGKVPWQAWENKRRVARCYGPEGQVSDVEDVAEKTGRRKALFDLAEKVDGGLDRLSEVLNGFLQLPG